jgi:3-isopropylmalate/(R)-2-methylmalate dehydratase small subunit
MTPFTTLAGIAAPFPDADVDTDIIFPARFLLLLDKDGLGKHLFHDRRWREDGSAVPDFILNRPPFDRARILVAGPRFGSGSSREQAVWTLADFGIRCVIAPSFGEIFFANCPKTGVLPVIAGAADHAAVMEAARRGETVTVDLETQRVSWPGGGFGFAVEEHRRRALLQGLDEIGMVLADDAAEIAAFERLRAARTPWLEITGGAGRPVAGDGPA